MKKLNQKGFTHHLLIFGLLALVVGVAGFAGWRIYKNKNLDAQAAGWTLIGGGTSGAKLYACKSSVRDSWVVKTQLYNPTTYSYVKRVSLSQSGSGTGGAALTPTFSQTVGPRSWGSVQTMNALKSNSPLIGYKIFPISGPSYMTEYAGFHVASITVC